MGRYTKKKRKAMVNFEFIAKKLIALVEYWNILASLSDDPEHNKELLERDLRKQGLNEDVLEEIEENWQRPSIPTYQELIDFCKDKSDRSYSQQKILKFTGNTSHELTGGGWQSTIRHVLHALRRMNNEKTDELEVRL